ncbi:hypothetical protein [Nostoc sp. UHCC 0251]|uniref:hypothetical protein n=1 Tax=Nostoc sp. UHCC 0251 TaxID=3110240 RepID=UPI002B215557|nr:hypothetical protein [Nostoc sp. UHCC 0251]MEA5626609.1 hypothetical protein [Nostoc sp. UHCC 0251]
MSKPLGYYTSYTPGDGSVLDELDDMFGSNLEKLTVKEKWFLIGALGAQLCADQPGEVSNAVNAVYPGILLMTTGDIEGLIEALVAQVRWRQNAEPVYHS